MNIQQHKPTTKGKSPYVKYGKSPYRYSDELINWTAAIKRGDKAGANRYDRAWRKKFGVGSKPDIRQAESNPLDYGDIYGDFDDNR